MDKDYQNKVAQILIDIESITFSFNNPFVLTSGEKSPVYVDCRKIISYTEERNIILELALQYIKENNLSFEILAGGETAGIPYASFLAEKMNKPMIYIRKKPKGFGKDQQIEGKFNANQKTILIEDLATNGESKVTFIKALRKYNLNVSDILVIFYYDIFDFTKTPLSNLNVKIHFLCSWKNIINMIQKNRLLSVDEIENLKFFLNYPKKWRKKYE